MSAACRLSAIDFNRGLVRIDGPHGEAWHELAGIWRDEALIDSLSPADAFRVGIEWGWRREREMMAPSSMPA